MSSNLLDTSNVTFTRPEPNRTVQFFDLHGNEVGCLDFADGEMKFRGNANESARIFFDHVLKQIVDVYLEEKLNEQ